MKKSLTFSIIIVLLAVFTGQTKSTMIGRLDSLREISFSEDILTQQMSSETNELICCIASSNRMMNSNSECFFSDYSNPSIFKPIESAQQESTVLICNSSSAYAYHRYRCSGLNRCKAGISEVSISEARNQGYVACKICY